MISQVDLNALEYLLTAEGQEALRLAASFRGDPLHAAEAMRRAFPGPYGGAALQMAELRRRAESKFSLAHRMYFTPDGLEQASAEAVAQHRARRFAGFARMADLCCGIGGDAVAIAGVADMLVAVDRDPVKVRMAELNLCAYGLAQKAFLRVGLAEEFSDPVDAVFIDPSRRSAGRRLRAPEQTEPPMSVAYALAHRYGNVCVKASPAFEYNGVAPLCEVEVISYRGEVKDTVLWFGGLRSCGRRATVLPEGTSIVDAGAEAPVGPPGAYLLEPDGAVVRAHLVDELAAELGAWKLDPNIAYLTCDRPVASALARCWRVLDVLPFNLKTLKKRLSFMGVGRVIVKKRGFPISPEEVRRMLKLDGPEEAILAIARVGGRHMVFVCKAADSRQVSIDCRRSGEVGGGYS
ncbi:MAG: THUMP-like domain-containing protein, partial [Armatimonadota bacterium]